MTQNLKGTKVTSKFPSYLSYPVTHFHSLEAIIFGFFCIFLEYLLYRYICCVLI
jgi:hypothetical protein